ncbi:MAG: carbohydrate binding family 9 domain-containing protein [Acidobacteriia bacterium]|nr:carbohydrate binding family 9 domain-containing protein [Terriglobia bacterium]
MAKRRHLHDFIRTLAVIILAATSLWAQQKGPSLPAPNLTAEISSLTIPRLQAAPKLGDFEGMEPASDLARKMLKIARFTQKEPHDGAPVSQPTEAYLGYTDKNFYAVFLAFDKNPRKLRARMLRRELIDDDDQVGMWLDTFHDHRHAYMFYTNPYGIQQDGLWAENGGPDNSFDTVWHTTTKITGNGYMVIIEVPFKSLRFRPTASVSWGIILIRVIPRNSEHSFFPQNTNRVQGMLTQEGTLNGFQEISPGRNLQFIPYTSLGAFRALDERDPAGDRFTGKHLQPKAGLDSKVVIKDSLVLDTTINPDFGQIESDDPQVTVNQRFEVFFPEKRPFFQENSNFFQTPLQLVFTRRIGDPLYGVRLTGKAGPWAIGTMLANDRSPGKSVIGTDPLSGENAYFGILRVNRELGKNNSVGVIYTDRELHTVPNSFCTSLRCDVGFNRVGGVDTQIKINQNWQLQGQAVTSETKFSDGTHQAGPAYMVYAERSSRNLEFNTMYQDIAQGFNAETGFINRTDTRRFSNFISRTFHPEGAYLTSHGPRLFQLSLWDHNGTRLNHQLNPSYQWNFQRNSSFNIAALWEHERLRPSDFSTLPANRDYTHVIGSAEARTQYFKWINLTLEMDWGTATNFVPRTGPPVLAYQNTAFMSGVVRPMKGLTVENTYIMTRLLDQDTHLNIFNNHIMRSKWNYQFTKEFSLRMIGQYVTTISNPGLTTLQTTKSFNGDVLFTYLVNPGTAIYAGYNSNLQNLDPRLQFTADGLLRTRNSFINDGRQIFIKLSYLLRY